MPIYTVIGLPDGSHFWPWSRLFTTTEDRVKCVVSGLCCAFCAYVAFVLCDYSFYNYIKYYWVPLSFQGLMMVVITYLQHQDENVEVGCISLIFLVGITYLLRTDKETLN